MASDAELALARRRIGPIQKRETRLALVMLAPTLFAVLAVVMMPLLANFWISVKPIELADLRAAETRVAERVRGDAAAPGDVLEIRYRLRSTIPQKEVTGARFEDSYPEGVALAPIPENCAFAGGLFSCEIGTIPPGERIDIELEATLGAAYFDAGAPDLEETDPVAYGQGENSLTNLDFTLENFRKVFDADEFFEVLWVSIVYTIGGTAGALLLGLFAAQLMMTAFPGRTFMRGLFLFPYVSPVIAVAFTWIFLLDGHSGAVNAILIDTGVSNEAINFLGQRGVALATVIAFEAWRYFPLAFLFILARMQSLSTDLHEAAEMDGATPFQQFFRIALPQLIGIVSTLFLLRFIWTFNKFDDIFLLTGGASGTRTLTVNVYEQAFALSNLGAGAAVAVVIFFMLAFFVFLYFKFAPKEEGM